MATINIGGRTVDVPDDLDIARPAGPTLRGGGSPTPQATPSPTAAFDAEVTQRAARLRQGGASAPVAPTAPLTPAVPTAPANGALYKAGMAAGGAADWVTGGKPGVINRAAGTLGRIGGLAATGESFMDNVQGMSNVFHSPDAKTSDKLAAAVEGAGNIIGTGALSLPSRLPFVGPVISGAVGPNPASLLADTTGDSVLNKFNPGKGFGSTRVTQSTAAAAPQGAPAPAAAPTTKPADIKNPYADANAAKLATGGTNAPAQPDALPPGYTNNVTRDGNSYFGTNVRGDITINGFPPGAGLGRTGPSDQNMATAADALAARDGLRSAAAVGAPQLVTPMLTTGNSDNSWSARNNLRNLETSASSIYHTQSHWGNRGKAAADTQAYLDAVKTDTALRAGADPMALTSMKLRADEANNTRTTDASRYGADQTLRGNVYQADATLGAKRMESQLKYGQQAAMGQIFRMAGNNPAKAAEIAAMHGLDPKPFIDMAQSTQTRQHNASTNAQSRLESLAIDPATNEISKGMLAQVRAAANSAVPGFEQMDEAEQNKHWKTVTAAVKAVQGLNATRDNGLLDFLSPESPALTQLPNVEGRRIERVSPWEGLTTRKVGHGDYKLTKPDAPPLYIPQQNVDENTLGMLKLRGATILDK